MKLQKRMSFKFSTEEQWNKFDIYSHATYTVVRVIRRCRHYAFEEIYYNYKYDRDFIFKTLGKRCPFIFCSFSFSLIWSWWAPSFSKTHRLHCNRAFDFAGTSSKIKDRFHDFYSPVRLTMFQFPLFHFRVKVFHLTLWYFFPQISKHTLSVNEIFYDKITFPIKFCTNFLISRK